MALHGPKPDGTEGTATAEMTYKEGKKKLTLTIYGCIVKNNAKLQEFIAEHITQPADLEKLKNTKYLFYGCDPDFKEHSEILFMKIAVTCHRFSKPGQPKSCELSNSASYYTVKVQEHIFLLCDFKDTTFMKNHSKKMLVAQNLNTGVIYGLSYKEEKKSPMFIPLELNHQSSNVYGVDAGDDENYEKLEDACPLLLEDKKTGKKKVLGSLIKIGNNKVSISVFGKNQVAEEGPSTSGHDNVTELGPSEHEKTDPRAQENSDDVVQVEPQSQTNNEKSTNTDGTPQPNITYVVNIAGNPKVVTVGSQNTVNMSIEGVEDAGNYDQNPPASDDDRDGTEKSNVDQSAADVAGDGTDSCPVVGFRPAEVCQNVISMTEGQGDIKTVDCNGFTEALTSYLELDRTSVETPPREIMEKCRKLCVFLKQQNRLDIFEKLKLDLPNGMTGPRGDESQVFQDLPVKDQRDLTVAMTGNDELLKTLVTELLRESSYQIGYYTRSDNPAEKILARFCQKRRLSVGDLYDILVRYGAAALADEYL